MSPPPRPPGTAGLLAAGCGTAIASVCAIGIFQIERLLGGIWSVAAVLTAGLCCAALARALGRLSAVVPSGAGLLAYLARGFGRRAGLVIAVPYLLLSLFLVGAEAIIVGVLLSRFLPIPVAAGALSFLLGTWALCRTGMRAGYRAQAIATWTLVAVLGGISVVALVGAAHHGELAGRLFPPAPGAAHFFAGVGQAFFLFMGFELVTSHAEVAKSPGSVRRALGISVGVLAAFYSLVSLGFSCAGVDGADAGYRFAPQLAIADKTLGPAGAALVVALSLLASFTSWNGGLLALSRFTAALASQGMLPRALGKLDPRTLVAQEALSALLGMGVVFTAIVGLADALEPSILAAAAAATFVYAAILLVRERAPFREPSRRRAARIKNRALAVALVGLGTAVVVDAGGARPGVIALLLAAYGAAWWASSGTRRPRGPAVRAGSGAVHAD